MSKNIDPLKRFGLDENEPDHTDEDIAKWCNDEKCPTCNKSPENCKDYGCGLYG